MSIQETYETSSSNEPLITLIMLEKLTKPTTFRRLSESTTYPRFQKLATL